MAGQPSRGCGISFQRRTFFLALCGMVIIRMLMIYYSYDPFLFDNGANDIPILKSSTVSLAMLDTDTTLAVTSSPYDSESKTSTTNIQTLTRELENSDIRYYVYDDKTIRLPWIRNRGKRFMTPTSRPGRTWARRFQDYARGEIDWLERLENSTLRTSNPAEADFFLVPIPLSATFLWGSKEERVTAFRRVFNSSWFQKYPEKHVSAIHPTEQHNFFTLDTHWGLTKNEFQWFANTTLIKDHDYNRYSKFTGKDNHTFCNNSIKTSNRHRFRNVVALGFSFAAGDPKYSYQLMTMEAWSKKKNWFFYHTMHSKHCNSDVYRSAFLDDGDPKFPDQGRALTVLASRLGKTKADVNMTDVLETFEHQPVSIGGQIPFEDWLRDALDAKFCLCVRGDNPASRSLFTSIRIGCMPIIISDALPHYQSLYIHSLKYDDFALVLPEDDFLADPVRSLDALVDTLLPSELERKVKGLQLVQRIMATDKADSLFVPALAKEVVALMSE